MAAKRGVAQALFVWTCADQKCYDFNGTDPAHRYLQESLRDIPGLVRLGNEREVVLSFSLPAGNYSFLIHHDRDSDGSIENDTCLLGKPRDGIAFSNNIDPRKEWGKPRWSQVRVNVGDAPVSLEIRPLYMCD